MSIYMLADVVIAACDWFLLAFGPSEEVPTGGMIVKALNDNFPGGWDTFVDGFEACQ